MVGWAAETSRAVAVLDFSVSAAEGKQWAWAEGGVADLLQIELQQQSLLLLDRDAIHAVLAEQRLVASSRTAENSLAIAKLLNAQFLISGKVIPLAGERFRVEASVFSVETVETAVAASGEGDFPKDLSQVVRQVAKQIGGKLPVRSGFSAETQPPVRAPKPEALIYFYRGLNACAAGQPEWGAAYFINAASLDPDFTVPLLWEIKAYEMAGLPQFADLRRQELVPLLGTNAIATPASNTTNKTSRPVLALLDPVISVPAGTLNAAVLADSVRQALLADHRVRVFAYEGIGAAVAEQDLRLSSFFISQNAPRYGRWLTTDALVFCQVKPAEAGQLEIALSLINPMNTSIMARSQQVQPATTLPEKIQSLTRELLSLWLKQPKVVPATATTLETSTFKAEKEYPDLRPIYHDLAAALALVRREPQKSDSHRALANALAAVARPRLAAHEIEQCLKTLDIHAPHADTTFLGTHRWLFWEPSPASGAAGLVDQRLIDHLIEQLLTTYPDSLAAGCMRYNLAVTAWRAEKWADAITCARQCRQTMEPIIARYDRKDQTISGGECECEMVAATYFLEGASLVKLGRQEEAKAVFHQGLDFMQSFKVRNFCLPLGPYIGDFFGPERVYGYGGDSPGIKTRLEQSLLSFQIDTNNQAGKDWITQAKELIAETRKLASPTETNGKSNSPTSSQMAWLNCAEKISSLLKRMPPEDDAGLWELLTMEQNCLSAAYGAPAAAKRSVVQKCVAAFVAKREKAMAGKGAELAVEITSDTTIRVMCLFHDAHLYSNPRDPGWETEAWTAVQPLLDHCGPVTNRLKLVEQLVKEGSPHGFHFKEAIKSLMADATNTPSQLQPELKPVELGAVYFQNHRYRDALDCYQKAVAQGTSVMACPGLAFALLEVALDNNLDHPADEIEKLRTQLGLPPIQASWVEWFATGRKYQTARLFDLDKAAASYRGGLDFLEHPEQREVYHLEKQPNCDRVALRWGPSLGEVDLLWSQNYDRRWYSAAFYLAQCLVRLDRQEEAAQWLRRIALQIGGDSALPLLDRDAWNSSGWSSANLGVRAAELLQELHQDDGMHKLGREPSPFQVPVAHKACQVAIPPLQPVEAMVLQALTNTLADLSGSASLSSRLQSFTAQYGHRAALAALSLLIPSGNPRNESSLIEILEQTANRTDAPWIVAACTTHYKLIPLAYRLDPEAAVTVLAEEWQAQSLRGSVSASLGNEIIRSQVRSLYALVLGQVAVRAVNYSPPLDLALIDQVVRQEQSDALEAVFCDSLKRCLKLMLQPEANQRNLAAVSRIALRHGVSEGINGLLIADGADPEKLRADLDAVLALPSKNDEVVAFLIANPSHWDWNPQQKKFQQSPQKDGL